MVNALGQLTHSFGINDFSFVVSKGPTSLIKVVQNESVSFQVKKTVSVVF
jgi:hypothetical protein